MHAQIREQAWNKKSVEIGSSFGTDTGVEPRVERSSSKQQYWVTVAMYLQNLFL